MNNDKLNKWKIDHPNGKASLSWDLEDYKALGDEPPECLFFGKTEGEVMERENVEEWASETLSYLSVIKEEYPGRYEEQYKDFVLNLEYLKSLGKITQEELEETKKEENISFGK